MKCAIAQLNPIVGDIKGNTQQIKEKVLLAVASGANLLLTPELSLCGYPPKDLLLNRSFLQQMESELEALALDIPPEIYVLVGTVTENTLAWQKGEKPFHNSIALIHGGKIQQIFHKRLLPTYDVFEETRYFQSGNQANFFQIDNVKIGVTICEDLWNEENFWGKKHYNINPIKELVNLDVDLVINLSASPFTVGKQKLREAMLSHIAKQYHKPIIYVNQIGGNDDLIFDGHSLAFNQEGELICRGKMYQEDLVYLDYDVTKQNLSGSMLTHISYEEEEEIYNALVLGVQDYARKCGFSKAVIGLSGGIDSALVATIATFALGKENVLGILMPSPYSSTHSITDAEALVKNLGIKSTLLPIQNIMESVDNTLENLFTGTEFGIAEENIQSRIRGTLLMAVANKFGYLLLSTGNKSEMSVGYCTLYGDMNGGLAVISDLPKTKVFSVCRWLNRQEEVIPKNIITKPPSAELKPNQLDQDSLPPYDILDDILDRYLSQHQSISEIEKAGYDLEIITKIIKMVARAEFKRKQAPPGLKITDRAFGTGWKMPIASRWYNE
jgi:NAD+ synthetase